MRKIKAENNGKTYTVEISKEQLLRIREAICFMREDMVDWYDIRYDEDVTPAFENAVRPFSELLLDIDGVLEYPYNPYILHPQFPTKPVEPMETNPYDDTWVCPQCGSLMRGDEAVCHGCGSHRMPRPVTYGNPYANPYASDSQKQYQEPDGPWTCHQCGTINPAGQMFCSSCGSRK